jgi:ribonuclease HII
LASRSSPQHRIDLADIREKLGEGARFQQKTLEALLLDGRSGAKALAQSILKRRTQERLETARLSALLKYERALWKQGHTSIAGVDEAGMAPLAGPVCAGAAILPVGLTIRGLDDSKKILNEARRNELALEIKSKALAWSVGWATLEDIEQLNIYHAGLLAMERAVKALSLVPTYLLVDARTIPRVAQPQQGIIKGDAKSLSIAAGAILAKTTRDNLMRELATTYPGYKFEEHKGYPTPAHLKALRELGACAIHRRGFAPVKAVLSSRPRQQLLF